MNNRDNMWEEVAKHVISRMKDLGMSQAELVRASALSDPLVRGLMRGTPRGNPKETNLIKASMALGWSPDSIDRILVGGEPVLSFAVGRPDDDLRAQLDELRQEGRVTRAMIRDLTERSALLLAAVEARIVLVERNQRAGRGAS
jgi:transcriptional regulator with XRE-family HTH domain